MKTLFLDCGMGAAGDMLTAALLELLPDPDRFMNEVNALGIPGVRTSAVKAEKCGITGTNVHVLVNGVEEGDDDHDHTDQGHEHHHHGMHEIQDIVDALPLSATVKNNVMSVYRLIADAESEVHGMPVSEIHFHEVGAMDAITDIVSVCMLMERLAPDQVIVSPVNVGSGHVHCAHGILPVPAPATVLLLRGIPMYSGSVDGELCTPTGAALLKFFATSYGDMPVMEVSSVGYGMGNKDFEAANCVRSLIGETQDVEKTDKIIELCCNVDDMTAEEIGFASEQLLTGGALDVFTIPIVMKKSRPGTLICVLCDDVDRQNMISAMFRYTSTLGIRENKCGRYVLDRSVIKVQTAFGDIRRKDASGYGVKRSKYEYDDLAGIARKQGLSISEIKEHLDHPQTR
jgi:uncharacterized protein (TIGR00299 family) protein